MQIAAVQLDTQWENRPSTHARVIKLLDGVELRAGALVVLPEMFDVGFSMDKAKTDPGSPSESETFCRKLAVDRNVAVLAGVIARTNDGGLANESVGFSPQGTELVRYRKMQPFTPPGEHICYPAGSRHARFAWQDVRIAPFICYDLRFPEIFRPAVRDGAEFIVVVANWPKIRSEHWVRLLQARAIENLAFVLGVNRAGSDPKFSYDGRSCLFDPHGNEVFQADAREQVLLAEVDATVARDWREKFPALRDMRGL
ncbi:MAG TPA: nitrilase-related carbon-nitrogen hydrolase [Tepidisphaeraceae bacterium]|jgi:predicted amidohydrolase|nr:nitrilase-related carbon-nitrogen hydrolase [Tepidisphaeraceae bacterium]